MSAPAWQALYNELLALFAECRTLTPFSAECSANIRRQRVIASQLFDERGHRTMYYQMRLGV